MNDNIPEELIVRWMDNDQLTSDEVTTLKQLHQNSPDLFIPREEFDEMQNALKSAYPSHNDLPASGIFQSSLMKMIEHDRLHQVETQRLHKKIQEAPAGKKHSWVPVVIGMAACFLFGLLLNFAVLNKSNQTQFIANATTSSLSPVVYSAYEDLSANVVGDENTSVIVINGLEALPYDLDLFSLSAEPKPVKVYPNVDYQTDEN